MAMDGAPRRELSEPVVVRLDEAVEERVGSIVRKVVITPSRNGNRHLRLVVNTGPSGAEGTRHAHRGDEILVTLRGEVTFRVGDTDYVCGPGTALLLPAGVEHQARVTSSEPWLGLASFCEECVFLRR